MLTLVGQGNLMPTAQQVADTAGLATRTVFRHFSEMELLYAEMDAELQPTYQDLFSGGDRSGELDERIFHAVQCHAEAYQAIKSIMRSTLSQLWRSPTLKKTYLINQRRLRRDLDDWLPELNDASTETREAIDAITSFEFWDRLQAVQGLSKKASVNLVVGLVKGLL